MTRPSVQRKKAKFAEGEIVVVRPSSPVKIAYLELGADGVWYYAD